MSRFFINRPIVAMVISIIMVIIGIVSFLSLPVAQYPNLVDPQVTVNATYVGGDALTVENSVATPIGQQMMGVDNMNYMYALNASSGGTMKLTVDFNVKTDPNIDLVLTQMRESQAESQLPFSVRNYGVTVAKSTAANVGYSFIFADGPVRFHVPGELRLYQLERRDSPGAWDCERHRLRCGPIRAPNLGRSEQAGCAQRHNHGYRKGD